MVPTTPPERRHQLKGRRKEQFAVDLDRSRRLVFKPANEPIPYSDDGGIDLDRVTAITILEVVDYH
jgi:proteic killer suppression protein